jgi:hypothetical protein
MLKLSVLNTQHDRRNYWQVKPKKVRLKKSTKPANSLHALSLEGILMAFGMLVAKQLSFGQVGLSSKLKTYVRTRYKALVGPNQKV